MKKIIILISLAVISCTNINPDFNTNPDYNKSGQYGTFKIDTLYAVRDSMLERSPLNTNTSTKLTLANMDGVKAAFVIRFINLPPDSVTVTKVDLTFDTFGFFGDTTKSTARVMVYKANKLWDASSIVNQDDDWRTNPPDELVTEMNVNLVDSMENTVEIPMSVFEEWRNMADSLNFGLYFKFADEETNLVCEFNSINSPDHPKLNFTFAADSADTVAATNDATIFDYDKIQGSALDTKGFFVSSGLPYHALLKFDFSSIPKDAIYFYTNLRLGEADENAYKNPDKTTPIVFHAVTNLDGEEFNPATAFSLKSVAGYYELNSPDILGTRFTQEVANGTFKNEWFEIQYLYEISVPAFDEGDFSKTSFKDVNSSEKPMLILKYFTNK